MASLTKQPACLRCKTTELRALSSPEEIAFWQCPTCKRDYAQRPGQALHFRWLHPISVVLSSVLFGETLTAEQAERTVKGLAPFSPDQRRQMADEIRLELDEPTQQVREILRNPQSEEDLRRFLALSADLLMIDTGTS